LSNQHSFGDVRVCSSRAWSFLKLLIGHAQFFLLGLQSASSPSGFVALRVFIEDRKSSAEPAVQASDF
jgi:hypothetical protein